MKLRENKILIDIEPCMMNKTSTHHPRERYLQGIFLLYLLHLNWLEGMILSFQLDFPLLRALVEYKGCSDRVR